jgi:hypothetical protein
MRRVVLALALCSALVLVWASIAVADVFGPIELASTRTVSLPSGPIQEQAEEAAESVISANGRYVAFRGEFGGLRGIWRRNRQTGEVEEVAPGQHTIAPSISAEGNYVSFTTTEELAPEDDHNHAPDVYVRDMEKPCELEADEICVPCPEHQSEEQREACPFELISAVNDTSQGAEYKYAKASAKSKREVEELEAEERAFGSFASPRSAISASGEQVVFESEAESNLLGSSTPADEILLRNRETKETSLVSSEYDPATNTDTGVPVPVVDGVGAAHSIPPFVLARYGGASISADGSTVAWAGQDIGRQAKLLPGEVGAYDEADIGKLDEPLWRRVDEGPTAPTRRVTGGSEPENPLCVASGEIQSQLPPSALDPCQGPFDLFRNLAQVSLLEPANGNYVPQLDKDGDKVAFLASAPEVAAGEEFGGSAEASDDLYTEEMSGGLTRRQALRRLTEIAGGANKAQYAPILDLAMSPEGNDVAFTTQRTQFPLGSPTFVSPIAGRVGLEELFDADLETETVTRVTHGYTGESAPSEQLGEPQPPEEPSSEGGAVSPSFAEDGNMLSFSSSADNLVYGDGNDASDAFVVKRESARDGTPQQFVSSPPPPPSPQTNWQMFATATPTANGTVVLDVDVPGPGVLSARVSGAVPVTVAAGQARAGGRGKARKAARSRIALVTRTVASAGVVVPPSANGLEELTLTLAPAYRALAQRATGVYTAIVLDFASAGHPTISTSLTVTFHSTVREKKSSARARGSRRRKGRRG